MKRWWILNGLWITTTSMFLIIVTAWNGKAYGIKRKKWN